MEAKPEVELESPFLSKEVLGRKSDCSLEPRAERRDNWPIEGETRTGMRADHA